MSIIFEGNQFLSAMKIHNLIPAGLLLMFSVYAQAQSDVDDSAIIRLRQRLEALPLRGMTVTDIRNIAAGSYTPPEFPREMTGMPGFFMVAATLSPVPASLIRIEMWMPKDGWNGRMLGTGNGGGGGGIPYASLENGIRQGYATVTNDLGTSRGGANAAVDNPEVWADFGHRATHEMTVAGKAILQAYYGKEQHHAYFYGCSTGGQQALSEAQRYPGDYNGIVAGAPANNRTHLHLSFLHNYNVTNQDSAHRFKADELAMISRRIAAAYATASGGAPGDAFLTDPRFVQVNFDSLFACRGGNSDSCLPAEKIAALKAIYAGPINPVTKEAIYTAPPVGSESVGGGIVMQQTVQGASSLFYQFKWVFGSNFEPSRFDFTKDIDKMDSMLAPLVNANNPDLSALKKLKGKIIMFTGTADPLVPFQDAVNYYERVIAHQGSLRKTQEFFRYFLVPGMGHCSGGPGLNGFNRSLLDDLVEWVEKGVAPEKVTAFGNDCCTPAGAQRFERPVFPYPKFAKYVGGEVNQASSYQGVDRKRGGVVKPAKKYLK